MSFSTIKIEGYKNIDGGLVGGLFFPNADPEEIL